MPDRVEAALDRRDAQQQRAASRRACCEALTCDTALPLYPSIQYGRRVRVRGREKLGPRCATALCFSDVAQ